jgi:hypothetical protein
MPFQLRLNVSDPGVSIDVSDDPAQKLADLLKTFGALDADPTKGKSSDQAKAFNGLKGNIIKAIQTEAKGNDPLLNLVRDCWNLICALYKGPGLPTKVGNDYELPVPAPPRAQIKATSVAIVKPSGQDYESWKLANNAEILWFRKYEAGLTYEPADQQPLSPTEWDDVVNSVWLLGKDYPDFRDFFKVVHKHFLAISSDPDVEIPVSKLRLRSLLRKLVPSAQKGRKELSLGGYKGACSEIEDMFRVGAIRRGAVSRIAVPKANKKFTADDLSDVGIELKKKMDLKEQISIAPKSTAATPNSTWK